MIVYELGPIDCWFGWTPFAEVIKVATKEETEWFDVCQFSAPTLRRAMIQAQYLARRLHWEGDMREGPWFCPLPEDDTHPNAFLLAWKQHNNGTTFIASPYRLPWLDKVTEGLDSKSMRLAW